MKEVASTRDGLLAFQSFSSPFTFQFHCVPFQSR